MWIKGEKQILLANFAQVRYINLEGNNLDAYFDESTVFRKTFDTEQEAKKCFDALAEYFKADTLEQFAKNFTERRM